MRNSGIMLTGDEHFALIQKMNDLEWERDQARAEVERLRETLDVQFPGLVEISKDAERYRWLRDHYPYAAHIAMTNTARGTRIVIDDAAIDDAMRECESNA